MGVNVCYKNLNTAWDVEVTQNAKEEISWISNYVALNSTFNMDSQISLYGRLVCNDNIYTGEIYIKIPKKIKNNYPDIVFLTPYHTGTILIKIIINNLNGSIQNKLGEITKHMFELLQTNLNILPNYKYFFIKL